MWIYKITNIRNNKVYIGQTINPVENRWRRHILDAQNNILDTHFVRAIRKYGADSFNYEIIDTAQNQDELNQKEKYWIDFFDSTEKGYNETDAIYKCGGNTYKSKTQKEMEVIKQKLSISKKGELNPMAKKIKRINVKTGEIDYFDTVIECAKKCNINKGKTSITERLNKKVTTPLHGVWLFEYCD